MARVQSVAILLLLLWMAQEYNHNEYFRGWATRTLGMFGFLLGGTLAALYSGILIAVYLRQPMTAVSPEKAEKREPLVVGVETR
jgi:formate-dependent nitrite reductase membrane component NrfD